jgi:hypothetical protein
MATRGVEHPALVLALLLAAAPAGAAEQPTFENVQAERETIGKWVATEKLIYQERRDWQQAKEILLSRIELVEQEIATLEAKLAETRQAAAVSQARRDEAGRATTQLAAQGRRLADTVAHLEHEVRALQPILPQPVQERTVALYQRIPEDPRATKVSVAERFQNVLGILNEITKANSEISLATEIRMLAGGKPSEVKTVYLGLAQAYYLSAGGEAGIGRPDETGWTWTAVPEIAPRVLEIVEILEGKAQPRFVPLPVKVQ